LIDDREVPTIVAVGVVGDLSASLICGFAIV
jgi:hypothetical protein